MFCLQYRPCGIKAFSRFLTVGVISATEACSPIKRSHVIHSGLAGYISSLLFELLQSYGQIASG
jgi:hypothetical protein